MYSATSPLTIFLISSILSVISISDKLYTSTMASGGNDTYKIKSSHHSSSKRSLQTRSAASRSHSVKADIAIEAAALKVKLKYLEEETRKQSELTRIQMIRDLDMAEAKLQALDQVEREDSCVLTDSSESDKSRHNTCSHNAPEINARQDRQRNFVHVPLPTANQDVNQYVQSYINNIPDSRYSPTEVSVENCGGNISNNETLSSIAKMFAEQVNLSKLPAPEPIIFSGDPLKYPTWKSGFRSLIEHKNIQPVEKMFYLKKYLSDVARESVESYFLLQTDNAFEDAKSLLEERFGNPFIISQAFRDKLESWPKIYPRDGLALRKFADFLRQCESGMNSIDSLKVLDDPRENKKLLIKLPDYLVNCWARIVHDYKQKYQQFPPFREFVKYLSREADIACDPVTSCSYKSNSNRSNPYEPRRAATAHALETHENRQFNRSERKPCTVCKGQHHLDTCSEFLKKNLKDRKEYIANNRLCFGCLSSGHMSVFCRSRLWCNICHKRHPTSLHGDVPERNDPVARSSVAHSIKVDWYDVGNKSAMIVPVWISFEDRERLVYALLDTQSDNTFVLDTLLDSLGVDGQQIQLSLSTMTAENQIINSRKVPGLCVRGYDSNIIINLPPVYSRRIMPANRSHIPNSDMARRWPHLHCIADQLPPILNCEIALLIGYNCPKALTPREVIPHSGNGPYAQRTDLGWGVVGIIDQCASENLDSIGCSSQTFQVRTSCNNKSEQSLTSSDIVVSFKTHIREIINPVDILKMMEIDFSDRNNNDSGCSHEDNQFVLKMNSSIRLNENSHYEMPLPFRGSKPTLPNNRIVAENRLTPLVNRFTKDINFKQDYSKFMNEIIEKNYAEPISAHELCNIGQIWYIPHHAVYHAKKPGKIRVVFDCNSKFKDVSLNDHLLKGPDLTNSLFGVLCRFRMENVAIMCDIEQMFYQFNVEKQDRDFLRFLWWNKGDDKPADFRMTVHLFGATSSPGCANFGLKQAANDFEMEFGSEAANFVRNNFYVDDGLLSVKTDEEAISLIENTKKLLAKCGLRLHKFLSNSNTVIESVPVVDRAKVLQNHDLFFEDSPIERCLGLQWCIESDTFQFRICLKDQPLTRRGILSTVSSIYDPLGLISPVILVGKQILQELCRAHNDWDSDIPDILRFRWEKWRSSLSQLADVKIERCYKPKDFGDIVVNELHHFSDASTFGYGQCSYLRLIDNNSNVSCSLVMSKSRVTPLKPITIPRLELAAALVSVRVSLQLRRELNYSNLTEVFWSDSKVVLGYINNDARRFQMFIANRIQQIRESSNPTQWRYIKSKDNLADLASRGVTAEELNATKWFIGPDFLWKSQLPSTSDNPEEMHVNISSDDPELKKVQSLATNAKPCFELSRLNHISDWFKAKRVIALCLRFKAILLSKVKDFPDQPLTHSPLTVEELRCSELQIIKMVQAEAFAEELKILKAVKLSANKEDIIRLKKSSSLYKLDPFLNSDNVICVGGRLKRATCDQLDKYPVILPKKHYITNMIVRYFHSIVEHQGRGITTNEIRASGYWIIGCTSVVSSHILRCVICRKLLGRSQEQKMSDLPEDRLETAPPFSYCGMDCFGPWYVKEGRKEIKRYGLLFVCMASRAIHIETLNDLSTDAFINGLRRFQCIRGPIRQLRCDNGTNFIGAKRELHQAFHEMDSGRIQKYLVENGCDYFQFKTNVPNASHMGGL
ncbi:uncharacterized protein LOC130013685 [Patella vulgata]|uniref:uncharacterized protein LOC130013685 n=1 Tax=Patella vulgata TaxID=6465 RepID=UPI0024A9C799|nr:uncharacterized protein LOC130013685 [Patella vulgata]